MLYNRGKVYRIFNIKNGKSYIGTTCATLNKRFGEHKSRINGKEIYKTPFHKIMFEEGVENFDIELIKGGIDSRKYLDLWEVYYMGLYDSIENGYNSTIGIGNYPIFSEDGKNVKQIDMETGEVLHIFNSYTSAGEYVGVSHSAISQCVNGKVKSCAGYYWEKV